MISNLVQKDLQQPITINEEYRLLVHELSSSEYDGLKSSIAQYGQSEPIKINPEGVILDGHHRYRACQELGIEPKFVTRSEEEGDSLLEKSFIITVNLNHRNLTPFQRIELVNKIGFIESELANRRKLSTLPLKGEKGFRPVLAQNCADTNEIGKTAAKLAKRAGVSTRLFEMGKSILKNGHSEADLQKLRSDAIKISKVYNYDQKQKKRATLLAEANTTLPNEVNLILGDFKEKCKQIPDNSVALLFTDPPYAKKFNSLYKDLGEIAFRVLKEGGSLVTYLGQLSLGEVYENIKSSGLRYNWIVAVIHTGGSDTQHCSHVFNTWKPLLWFVKGSKLRTPDYIRDSVQSQPPDKSLQDWAQSPVEAEHVISKLTVEGDTVLDCFMGSGTTGIAAINLKRQFIGIEIDQDRLAIAINRMARAKSQLSQQRVE